MNLVIEGTCRSIVLPQNYKNPSLASVLLEVELADERVVSTRDIEGTMRDTFLLIFNVRVEADTHLAKGPIYLKTGRLIGEDVINPSLNISLFSTQRMCVEVSNPKGAVSILSFLDPHLIKKNKKWARSGSRPIWRIKDGLETKVVSNEQEDIKPISSFQIGNADEREQPIKVTLLTAEEHLSWNM